MAEKDQQIRDFLRPFLVSKNLKVQPRNSYYGFLPEPTGYGRWGSARIWTIKEQCVPCAESKGFKTQEEITAEYLSEIKEFPVDLVDEQRWAACLNHLTKSPTLSNPKMTQIDNGWRVAPRSVSIVALDWYKIPKEGTFIYTEVAGDPASGEGDYIQYDANASTPLEWPESVLNYFLWKLAKRYGIFIGNTFLSQFAKQEEV